jgi:alpha-glucosidase (family GH31 glycosyl hydrolase)
MSGLASHLRVETHPKALAANLVYWRDYRVSVLQSRLFRLEQSPDKIFLDEATQSVWFRDLPAQTFKVVSDASSCKIVTPDATLILAPVLADCRIELGGKSLALSNEGNLLSTAKTLDNYDGDTLRLDNGKLGEKIHLENGVCSRSGVAVIDDSAKLILRDDGELSPALANHKDLYLFAYGEDYRSAVQALFKITGKTPLLPRFALGNWWSRYHEYTDQEYLTLLHRFVEHQVPLTVATIDMDWHPNQHNIESVYPIKQKNREGAFYGGFDGWTGYTWNPALFPNYRETLKQVHALNLKITLNLHPALGIRWFEEVYPAFAKALGVDASTGKAIPFDFTNPKFINAYFALIDKPYEKDGVDFWWIDWQQGSTSALAGLDPLWALNHYHYLDHLKNHTRGLILSRYAGVGSHRYPVGFSGDSYVSWATLAYLPCFTATATNIGYTDWSHDIGGHQKGICDQQLYLRSIQFGVFSPINRLHCCDNSTLTKEPWVYQNGTGLIAMDFLRLRHQMVPFLYTAAYRTTNEGLGLIEPLYYDVKTPEGYNYPNEYLFGGTMIVLPITSPLAGCGLAKVRGLVPQGHYVDFFTRDVYDFTEDTVLDFYRPLESMPVLLKAGSVVPLSLDEGNSVANPQHLLITLCSGNGSYSLYEDKLIGKKNQEGFTDFVLSYEAGKSQNQLGIRITYRGFAGVFPKGRILTLRLLDEKKGTAEVFDEQGNSVAKNEPYTDNLEVSFVFDPAHRYSIRFVSPKVPSIDLWKEQLLQRLLLLEGGNEAKLALEVALKKAGSFQEMRVLIGASSFGLEFKGRLLEGMPSKD